MRLEIRKQRRLWAMLALLGLAAAVSAPAQDLTDWSYYRAITIDNTGHPDPLTDYQVRVDLTSANFDFAAARVDGGDIQFTDDDQETLLDHWLETWNPTAQTAVIWIKVPQVAGAGTKTIYMYYGNAAASSTSDGESTFVFYDSFENFTLGACPMNAPTPLTTPTYDGSGQVVHPDVLYIPGGWNGYAYWMAMTPYPNSNDNYENPSILVSNDGLAWSVPPGLTNPIVPEFTPDHNADTDLLIAAGTMYVYFVEYDRYSGSPGSYIKMLSSTNGINWSAPQTVLSFPGTANLPLSPAILYEDGTFYMWYVQSSGCSASSASVYLRTSTDGISWGAAQLCSASNPGRVNWHPNVVKDGSKYVMLTADYPTGSSCGNTRLYYAESTDRLNWTFTSTPVLSPCSGHWDGGWIYRVGFLSDGGYLRIWYSAGTGSTWRVGYTQGDLDDFLNPSSTGWDVLNGNLAATTTHPRTGSYGLREIGAATPNYPRAVKAVTGQVCCTVWLYDDLATTTNLMALLRAYDGLYTQAIGAGLWTGRSTTHYSYHYPPGWVYYTTTIPRTLGWHQLSVHVNYTDDGISNDNCVLLIDGQTVATRTELNESTIWMSLEGYQAGTSWWDDAYVRQLVSVEPTTGVGPQQLTGIGVVGVDVGGVGCLSTAHTCAVDIPVEIVRHDTQDGIRGYNVVLGLSPELALCDEASISISEGDYLSSHGPTAFFVVDHEDGTYAVSCALLGPVPMARAASGTLFELDVTNAVTLGTGTLSVLAVSMRDSLNAPLTCDLGDPESLTIDAEPPEAMSALAALQVLTGNPAGQTTGINLFWPAVETGAVVDLYRKGFGNYPEYDDEPGAGSEPSLPASPPEAVAQGWTQVAQTSDPTYLDAPPERDHWHYAAFVTDACDNVSAVSNLTAALNYHLGDVYNSVTQGTGDNLVAVDDITLLAAGYGTIEGEAEYRDYLDVGPTTDFSVLSRPTTNNEIEFEDLMMFALNFSHVGKLPPAPAAMPHNLLTLYLGEPGGDGTLEANLWLQADGRLQGVSIRLTWDPNVVEPIGFVSGLLMAAQGGPNPVLSPRPGSIDAALCGRRPAGICGEGRLATVSFRRLSEGDPQIDFGEVVARDQDNKAGQLDTAVQAGRPDTPLIPSVSLLAPNRPNPFNPRTTLFYGVAQPGHASLRVYDLHGRCVRTLVDQVLPAGMYELDWDGTDAAGRRLASGAYVARLVAPDRTQNQRMMLLK